MTIYIVPVSGGKDSQLVLSLAVEQHGPANVIGLHNFTGIDHPLTMAHMDWMRDFYGVPIEHTENQQYRDMWELLDKRNAIPGRVARFCTHELKINASNRWLDKRKDLAELVFLFGMRAPESAKRFERYHDFEPTDIFSYRDLQRKKIPKRFEIVRAQLPIVNLTTPQVFEILRKRGEKVNPLYARGHRRVGCYPCILAGKADFTMAARDPVGRQNIIVLRDFKTMLAGYQKGKYSAEQIMPHDLDAILDRADSDPFGLDVATDGDDGEEAGGCQWCAI